MSNTWSWINEVAVVTGASSGIGAAIAEELARAQMKVVLIARRLERVTALAHQLNAAGGHAVPMQLDLRDPAKTEETLKQIGEQLGPIRVLVNNAGLGHSSPLTSGKTEHWREMLEVNVLALCVCTREATQQMITAGDWGQVIHISSMSAHRVPSGSGVYSATKYAVRSLTEGLRQELRDRSSQIRVASISPGFVETEFAAHYHRSQAVADSLYQQYQVLLPKDIASAVCYILSQPPHAQVHDLLLRPTQQQS